MPLHKLAPGRIVVHDQDQGLFCLLLNRMRGLRACLPTRCNDERLIALRNSRQPNCKRRATAKLALDRDVASHHLAKAFADREPEAGAAVFPSRRCVSLREFLEQPAHLLRRHADTGIGYSDGDPIAAVFLSMPCVNSNGSSLCTLLAIAHNLDQALPQP